MFPPLLKFYSENFLKSGLFSLIIELIYNEIVFKSARFEKNLEDEPKFNCPHSPFYFFLFYLLSKFLNKLPGSK